MVSKESKRSSYKCAKCEFKASSKGSFTDHMAFYHREVQQEMKVTINQPSEKNTESAPTDRRKLLPPSPKKSEHVSFKRSRRASESDLDDQNLVDVKIGSPRRREDEPVDLRDGFVTVATPDLVVSENARLGGTATVLEQVLATNAPATLTMVNGRVEVHIFHHSHGTAVIESLQRYVKSLQEAIRGQKVDTMRDMRKKRVHSSSGDGSTRNSKK